MKEQAELLRAQGLSYRQIKDKLGISTSGVYYLLNPEIRISKNAKQKAVKSYTDSDRLKAKSRMLKHRYGISIEDYNIMYENQNGACGICNEQRHLGTDNGLYVDHNHKTGAVRGLLCPNCNAAIGKLKESQELLLSAIQYLNIYGNVNTGNS